VLENGLEAWKGAGFPTVPVDPEALPSRTERDPESAEASSANSANTHTHAFLPGLVENYANRHELPIKRELTVLFVDIADSTPAILGVSPEEALRFVQRFMGIVTEAALTYCGDVKDYEGDGALLYFESVTEATQAALSIRDSVSMSATS
jgi:class 3 adenylate cyclase